MEVLETAMEGPAAAAQVSASACVHCGQPLPRGEERFCCRGCEAVWGLLHAEGLERYYQLRGDQGSPATVGDARGHGWLQTVDCSGGRVSLDVQGIHCSACVWLMQELFRRQKGGRQIQVNPGIGRLELWFEPGEFSVADYARKVESFGYLLGPARKAGAASRSLALRAGAALALALNSMILSFAFHFGLSPEEGLVYEAFGWINLAVATVAVAVGGSFFFRTAWASLRHRALHLDLPIALGIALSYAGSVWAFLAKGGGEAYFDSVALFTALMLLGKYLPQRLLERNLSRTLEDDGVDRLPQRRVGADGSLQAVAAAEVRQGELLSFSPGDLVAVDVRLEQGRAVCSLDWITGEPAPRTFSAGETVPAGAFNLGPSAFRGQALSDFSSSRIRALLSAPRPDQGRTPRERFLDLFSRFYVAAVLGLGTATFAGWWLLAGDLDRALLATVAVLVVTCPCAIGLATPLAYELAMGRLRRRGLFARNAAFLDKLPQVRELALDKTGTLTAGELLLANPEALGALGPEDLQALRAMVEASNHPQSRGLAQAMGKGAASPDFEVIEIPGQGLEARGARSRWRLGSAAFVLGRDASEGAESLFARDGAPLARFRFAERARPDAAAELRALRADGLEVHILSGDAQARAEALGASLGIEPSRCQGGLAPEDKARWIRSRPPRSLLMLGDGVNDALAFGEAWVSGTPAIHRPFVPSKADFYYLSAGIAPIREALSVSRRLARVVRLDLAFALTYNAAAVALAALGLVTPLFAAIAMPASSLLVVAATSWAMAREG